MLNSVNTVAVSLCILNLLIHNTIEYILFLKLIHAKETAILIPISVIILMAVLMAIALRKALNIPMPIWGIMTIGALAVLISQQISLRHALSAIEPDVILYLFGVFLICQAAESSGYLEQITDQIFTKAQTGQQALLIIVFILGISAAFLMNDTVAIIGTPIILQLCKSHKQLSKPLLLALAYSITIGSVLSPIGNPQNLLIAVKGEIPHPFLSFIQYLGIPTLVNLVLAYLFIYFIFRKTLSQHIEKAIPRKINDNRTAWLVKLSFLLMIILITVKIFTDFIYPILKINFSYIAIISALPIFFSKQRLHLLRKMDWGTLLFFVSIFILMQSVWDSNFFQKNIEHFNIAVTHIPVILMLSILLSQFISNVPLVALYLPLLINQNLPTTHLLALAAGSTIAGNLSILGAASNIIILQNVENRGGIGFGFFEFIKYGCLLTLINTLVYAYFLKLNG